MKPRIVIILVLALAALLLAACGGVDSPAPASLDAEESNDTGLDTTYENALALRNQLLLGTLSLEDTPDAAGSEQAAALLPLWQALRGTINTGASAQAEVDALLRQIEGAMSAEQLAAIRAMRLTQADLQAWAQSQGISAGSGEFASAAGAGGGMGTGQGGAGQNLSPEERATRQAERGGTGENRGGLSNALLESVISLLESK